MLTEIVIYSVNPDVSAVFYTALGADLEPDTDPQPHWCGGIGDATLALYPARRKRTSQIGLGITVTDIAPVWDTLESLRVSVELTAPGMLTAYDPDDNRVTVREGLLQVVR